MGYFPILLAIPFFECSLNSETWEVNPDSLLNAVFQFIPGSDSDVLRKAIDHFETDDLADMSEALESYGVVIGVTEDNFRSEMQKAAHKTILQAPAYIANCWRLILMKYMSEMNDALTKITEELKPNVKQVLKCIHFEESNTEPEKTIGQYLKKFWTGTYVKQNEGYFTEMCTHISYIYTTILYLIRISVFTIAFTIFKRSVIAVRTRFNVSI